MRGELEGKFEGFYLGDSDPWSYWSSHYEVEKYHRQLALVSGVSQSPRSILEIGCSTGSHTRIILERFPLAKVIGIDISLTAIERAIANLDAGDRVRFINQDVFVAAESFEPDSFDLIIWSEGFDYLHGHCSIAEFSNLCRQLAVCLTAQGLLCVSHILPDPLAYGALDAGSKNVAVFHSLIGDYFARTLHHEEQASKEETDRRYRYAIDLYRPRLLGVSPLSKAPAGIDSVDVVIPARDENDTIAAVVRALSVSDRVERVFAIDNGSADGTAAAAKAAGAVVVDCPVRGYGRAVKRGIAESGSRWVLKVDADIENFETSWVDELISAAETNGSSLVKACWAPTLEDPDRVTNFTVRPAFEIFFPELLAMRSPLSGIYLLDRSAFDWRRLPNDFAFDVAMLVAQLEQRRRTCEVDIPSVRHASVANGKRTYDHYHRMSAEILRYLVGAGLARVQ